MSIVSGKHTRLLMFTLFGDYLLPRQGWAWTASLIQMLGLLGVSSEATRSTLSRMSREGWLMARRRGRHSLYALSPRGRHLLEEGTRRIFERRPPKWDGKWRVVVYSLPEKKRNLREALRRRLSFLGFGALGPGTWICPHDRQAELDQVVEDLSARRYLQYFEGRWLSRVSNEDLVARCWDLKTLNRRYAAFLERWRPELRRFSRERLKRREVSSSRSFARRFWIIHEYSFFPSRDPNLPAPLLPQGWLGNEAAGVFQEYRSLLTRSANSFVDEMLKLEIG